MNQFSDADATITFDGLMLLAFEEGDSKCEKAEFGIVHGEGNDTHTFRINVLEIDSNGQFLHPEIKTEKNVEIYLKNTDDEVIKYEPGVFSRKTPASNDPQDLRWCLDLEKKEIWDSVSGDMLSEDSVPSINKSGFPAQILTIKQGIFYTYKLKEVFLHQPNSLAPIETKVASPIGCAITVRSIKSLAIRVEGEQKNRLELEVGRGNKLYVQVTNYDNLPRESDVLTSDEGDVRLYYNYCLKTDLQYRITNLSKSTDPNRICNPGRLGMRTEGIQDIS